MDAAEEALRQGYTLAQAGAHAEALEAFSRAEALCAAAGDGQRQALACANKALTLAKLQRFDEALAGFGWALQQFERDRELVRVAEQYGNIGSIHRDLDQPSEALAAYAEALAIYRQLEMPERIADQYTNIAYAQCMMNEPNEALRWYREAVSLYAEAGSERKRTLTADNVARLEAALGRSAE